VIKLGVTEARTLIEGALVGAGAGAERIGYFADAILDTELSGLEGHGFYWLQYYCAHLRSGKVDGAAEPRVERLSGPRSGSMLQTALLIPRSRPGSRY
jgi:(2R)-3-sulfolactate dehydrogenase (NADP+)